MSWPQWMWAWCLSAWALIGSAGAVGAEWQTIPGGRTRSLDVPSSGKTGFTRLAATQTGLAFTNALSMERYTTNQIYLNGSGVTLGDIDGDGWCDVFFGGVGGGSRLFRNRGNWQFEDVTAVSGVQALAAGLDVTGVVLVDLDGDRDLDLVVNTVGTGTRVWVNDGSGRFQQMQVLNPGRGAMSLALGDVDGDGRLDLYVANYRQTTLRDHPLTNFRINRVDGKLVVVQVDGRPVTEPDLVGRYVYREGAGITEFGEVDAFFFGREGGKLEPVPFTQGTFLDENGRPWTQEQYDWGLSVMMRDFNGDGLPDIYVCNDFHSPDRIWINTGGGKLQSIAKLALRNTSRFSMGLDIADYNRDGFDDVFVADMQSRSHELRATRLDKSMDNTPVGVFENRVQLARNTLQRGRGDGTFAELALMLGLEATEWSWTPLFLDVDLDGWEDLLVTAGHGRDDMDIDSGMRIEAEKRKARLPVADQLRLRTRTPALPQAKSLYRNLGGRGFEEVGAAWGFGDVGVAHGMCVGDLDNDGDLDVVVNQLNGPAGVYRNESAGARVGVRLKGTAPNTAGIGAKIWVYGGAVPRQSQEMICGGRYLSGDAAERVFAAGSTTNRLRIEVEWRSGRRSVVEGVFGNRVVEIAEAEAEAATAGATRVPKREKATERWFEDVSAKLGHTHVENEYADFERQPLLPHKLSELGPGVGWIDLDGDGRDDVVVGSGQGGRLGAYRSDGRGGFEKLDGMPFAQVSGRDQSGLVGFWDETGGAQVLVGLANYEDGVAAGGALRVYEVASKRVEDGLEAWDGSVGPMAVGVIDAEGTLGLFLGGRAIGGKYPEATASRLYVRRKGEWELEAKASVAFATCGLVSGAVWTDLDGDGVSELVLACEWGGIRIYARRGDQWVDATAPWRLAGAVGLWNGVTSGDFDGDGRMDLVASNWGWNSGYRVREGKGTRLYWTRLAGSERPALLEAAYDPGLGKWVPEADRDALGREWPWVPANYPLHRDFARAGVAELLGDVAGGTKHVELTWLATSVWLNRGDHFERVELPEEAQWSVGYGVSVADYDGDGREDLFLSQNFFGVPQRTARSDAGRGLLLRGDGRGGFTAWSGSESGIEVYGEGRGSAVGDYDGDGRVDLLVGQNGGATRVFRNVRGQPGLRVRLKGPNSNRFGIGARLRLGYVGGGWGPLREVHGGSGYWSQDAVVSVLGKGGEVDRIEVRWPGRREGVVGKVPAGAQEITVNERGEVEVRR